MWLRGELWARRKYGGASYSEQERLLSALEASEPYRPQPLLRDEQGSTTALGQQRMPQAMESPVGIRAAGQSPAAAHQERGWGEALWDLQPCS